MRTFKDNFSKQSDTYLKYRPSYPEELFAYLSSITPEHNLAWDCATGNGQAAIGLSRHFDKVHATDASGNQIRNAILHERVTYKVETAEQSSLPDHSADLVTIAQALHWFDFDTFYREVKRVLKPGGIIAAWAYAFPDIDPETDRLFRYFHNEVVGEFWQRENRMIENHYRDVPFPFPQVQSPEFTLRRDFSFDDMTGLLNTWSAVQRFKDTRGFNPVDDFSEKLRTSWPENTIKEVTWKLILKVGKVNA